MTNKPKTGMNDETKKMILIAKTFFLARVHNVPYLTTMKIHYRLFVLELFID